MSRSWYMYITSQTRAENLSICLVDHLSRTLCTKDIVKSDDITLQLIYWFYDTVNIIVQPPMIFVHFV